MSKKFYLEMKILNYLDDIKGYAESTYQYITQPETVYDPEEVITCLNTIPDYVDMIELYFEELAKEYENEQLQ